MIPHPSTSRREPLLAASLVVLVTLITYGSLIPGLGFYRDDWYLLWTAESLGPRGLLDLFRGDRPFVGWLYLLDFSLLGPAAAGWHLYVLAIKAASALGFLWLLRILWPHRTIETTFAALLFIVYPGFYQQPNALTFKQLLLAYMALLFSLAFTMRALEPGSPIKRSVFTVLGALLGLFYILIYEALVGMEAVRLILIWHVLRRSLAGWRQCLGAVIRHAIPYLAITVGFIAWRIFVFQSTRRATSIDSIAAGYATSHGGVRLFFEYFKDLLETSILAWGVPFYQFSVGAIYKDLGLALGLALLVSLLSLGYYFLVKQQAGMDDSAVASTPRDWLLLGLAAITITTVPIVAAGRNVLFGIQWDRYTYQSVFGVSLFINGFIFYALHGKTRWIVLGMLLAAGVSTQVFSGLFYRDFWETQREAWWQLYWRAPRIADGTTVIASLPGGFQFAEEYEIWGPLNLVYHQGGALKLAGQVIMDRSAIDLEHGTVEDRLVRGTITVNRDYNRALVVALPSASSCLRVYDGKLPLVSVADPLNLRLAAPYSDLGMIDPDAPPPRSPEWIIGAEPQHGWCFYYQKINRALQSADWIGAAKLADEARSADLQPLNLIEWMAPLQAYANVGDEKRAKQVSTYINDRYTRLYLCQQLTAVDDWPEGYRSEIILRYLCKVD
jgi:hypothetical protein